MTISLLTCLLVCPAYSIRDTIFCRRQADCLRAFTRMAIQVEAIACLLKGLDAGIQLCRRDEMQGALLFSSSPTSLQLNEQRSSFFDRNNDDSEQSCLISFLQTLLMLVRIYPLILRSRTACLAKERRPARPRVFPRAFRDGVKVNFLGPDKYLTVTYSLISEIVNRPANPMFCSIDN